MMSLNTAKTVRTVACQRKRRMGIDTAKVAARKVPGIRAYLCPFCQGWHVGHTPSMESLHTIAEAIRVLAQQEERAA